MVIMKKFLLMFFLANSAMANGTYTCWDYAASKFNLDPWRLFAIAAVESNYRVGIKSRNTNNTYDLGLMQINTIHLPHFNKVGMTANDLQYDSCKNIVAAAYLLKRSINKYGDNIDGWGGYHSNTPSLRKRYGRKVDLKYKELVTRYHVNGEHFSFESYRQGGSTTKTSYTTTRQPINTQQVSIPSKRQPLTLSKTISKSN